MKYFSLLFLTLLLVACNDEESLVYLESLPVEHIGQSKMPLTKQEPFLSLRLPIGAWDMNTLQSTTIIHGLDYQKIIEVSAMIRNDSDSAKVDFASAFLHNPIGGVNAISWNATNVIIERIAGGFFNNLNYNDNALNRGFILIKYLP